MKNVIVRGSPLATPRKILIRATNWIGDVVMSMPALEALRARFPQAETVVLAKPWVSELYTHLRPALRQILYDPESRHRGWAGFQNLIHELRGEHFDAAILFQNAFQAAWLAWRAHIPIRIGYARDGRSPLLTEAVEAPSQAFYGHQAYYYLHLLFRAGLIDKLQPLPEVRLVVDESERLWAERRLEALGLGGPRSFVGLAPGSTFGPAKRWLSERFAALADRLIGEFHADVLIFGSPAERALAEEVARAMKHTPMVLAGETNLRQLLALLAQCRLVVSNDSGPMHLAAALGVPLVAVFGSTEERATGPLSARARVVRHRVACSPCGLRQCPIDFRCMESITVEEVYTAARALLEQSGASGGRLA